METRKSDNQGSRTPVVKILGKASFLPQNPKEKGSQKNGRSTNTEKSKDEGRAQKVDRHSTSHKLQAGES